MSVNDSHDAVDEAWYELIIRFIKYVVEYISQLIA